MTGEPSSIVSVSASPVHELLPPWAGSDWLTQTAATPVTGSNKPMFCMLMILCEYVVMMMVILKYYSIETV
jgi:hypothetical protein